MTRIVLCGCGNKFSTNKPHPVCPRCGTEPREVGEVKAQEKPSGKDPPPKPANSVNGFSDAQWSVWITEKAKSGASCQSIVHEYYQKQGVSSSVVFNVAGPVQSRFGCTLTIPCGTFNAEAVHPSKQAAKEQAASKAWSFIRSLHSPPTSPSETKVATSPPPSIAKVEAPKKNDTHMKHVPSLFTLSCAHCNLQLASRGSWGIVVHRDGKEHIYIDTDNSKLLASLVELRPPPGGTTKIVYNGKTYKDRLCLLLCPGCQSKVGSQMAPRQRAPGAKPAQPGRFSRLMDQTDTKIACRGENMLGDSFLSSPFKKDAHVVDRSVPRQPRAAGNEDVASPNLSDSDEEPVGPA